MDAQNAGEVLRSLLEEHFPNSSTNSFAERIDDALFAGGQLAELVYRGTINYLLRRLISSAVMIERRCLAENAPAVVIEKEVRAFINRELNFPLNAYKTERIVGLLIECLRVRGESIAGGTHTRIRQRGSRLCYICGRQLEFSQVGLMESAELEHIFPREMGGSSKWEENLAYACHKCNQVKQSFIDDSDFHFEEICLSTEEKDEDSFEASFHYLYKVAAWAKSRFGCDVCGEPASRVGPLSLMRKNVNDSWHFLNIAAYCPPHALKFSRRRG